MGWIRGAGRAGLAAAALAAVLAAVLAAGAAGCSAGPSAPPQATEQACYAFVVQAVRRHVTLATVPRACAGLSREQIDEAAARAIHDVAGLGPKAVARRRASQDSRYVARLIRAVPVPAAPRPAPQAGSPAGHGPGTALRLAALAAWVVTAAAGAYLLAGWLAASGLRGVRGRRSRAAGRPPAIPLAHAVAAVAGLGFWLAFVASGVSALAWTAAGLILPAAGLGMAALLAAPSGPGASAGPGATAGPPASAGPASRAAARPPVMIIALHGVLATATILLVLLAAIGVR